MMDLCISFSKYRKVYKPYKPIKPVRGFMQSELVPSPSPRTPHLCGLIMFITKLPKPKSLASSLMPCHLVHFHFQSASKSCDTIHVNAPFPATPFPSPTQYYLFAFGLPQKPSKSIPEFTSCVTASLSPCPTFLMSKSKYLTTGSQYTISLLTLIVG